MDLYEPDKIGGRLATSFVNGFEFETGGSIIHSANKYMNLYVEKFSKYNTVDIRFLIRNVDCKSVV